MALNLLSLVAIYFATLPEAAFAAATGMTFHGRILQPNGRPLEAASVFFHIQIRSPGSENCLLFDEQQTLNMSGSSGIFVITIGQGTRAAPAVDGGYTINKIFANRGTLTGLTCNIGSTYSAAAADGRILQVQFNDGSGWQTLPPQDMNYNPLAIEALQVSGYSKDQLLRVADGTVATEFTAANWTALWDLITGASTVYSKADGSNFSPGADVSFNSKKAINLADPTAAQDAATKNYVDTTTLARAGGTMTGSINMGLQSVTNVGHVVIASQGTLWLGKFTTAQENTLITGPPALGLSDTGRTWYNTTTGRMRYWDGAAAQNVSSESYVATQIGIATASMVTAVNGTAGEINSTGGTTPTLSLISTAVTAGSYGSAITVPTFTVDAKGRLTLASNVPISVVGALGYTPVNRAGDSMSGFLFLSSDPSSASGAATKQYVDAVSAAAAGAYIRKDGTTALTADWDLDGASLGTIHLTGLAAPVVADGAATKGYVDASVAAATYTLPNTSVVAGSYGSATQVSKFTVDAQGRLTSASNVNIALPLSQLTAGAASTGDYIKFNGANWVSASFGSAVVAAEADPNVPSYFKSTPSARINVAGGFVDLANSGVSAGSYGSSSQVPTFVVDQYGRLTSASYSIVNDTSKVPLAGGTMTGSLILSGNPTLASQAATKAYVDAAVGSAGTITSVNGVAGETVIGGTSFAPTVGLANTAVVAATYGAVDKTLILTVDSKGRLTSASQTSIAIAPSQITAGGASSNDYLKWSGANWVAASFGAAVVAAETDPTVNSFAKNVPASMFTTPSGVLTLANTSVAAGSYGSAVAVPSFTVDAQGRLTQASNISIALPVSQLTAGAANTGDYLNFNGTNWVSASFGAAVAGAETDPNVPSYFKTSPQARLVNNGGKLDLNTSGVGAATYGSSTQIPVLTVDAYGRITGASFATASVTELDPTVATYAKSATGLSGRITTTANQLDLASSGVVVGTYGSTTTIPILTVDTYGRVTVASSTNLASAVNSVETDPTVPSYFKTAPQARLVNNAGKLDLNPSGVSAATYGSSSQIPVITVDTYGRLTSASFVTVNDTSKLPLAGGTMSGAINMASFGITNLLAPTNPQDAANKAYVDAAVGSAGTITSVNGVAGETTTGGTSFAPTIGLANTAVAAGTYGSTSQFPVLTVDSKGRVTSASYIDLANSSLASSVASSYFKKDGTSLMTGNIQLNGNWLSNDGGNEGITVSNAGDVGIGTASASSLLEVRKDQGIRTALTVTNQSGVGQAAVLTTNGTNYNWMYTNGNGYSGFGTDSAMGLGFDTSNAAASMFWSTGGSEKMRLSAAGQLGIGTTTPGDPGTNFEVDGATNSLAMNVGYPALNPGEWTGIGMGNPDFPRAGILFEKTTGNGRGSLHFATGNTAAWQSVSYGDVRMSILRTGNVGIGTTSPNSLLTVEGVTALRETTAPALTASYGKIYVKSSDSKLYFMNSSGVENQLGTGAGSETDPTVATYAKSATGLSGRITTTANQLDLASSGVAVGTYGSTTTIPILTVDTYGRVTVASQTSLASAETDPTVPSYFKAVPQARLVNNAGKLDLASGVVNAGTYGSATQIPILSVDTYGRVTSATFATATVTETDPTVATYAKSATGLSARITTTANQLDLASSGVATGTYGSATQIPILTVDTYGRVTSATFSTLSAYSAGNTILASFGSAASPGLSFLGDSDTGIFEASANYLGFATGGSQRMVIDSSGNLGIGTAAPAQLLEVRNDQNATTAIQVSNNSNTGSALSGLNLSSTGGLIQLQSTSAAQGGVAKVMSNNTSLQLSAYNSSGYLTFGTGGSGASFERMRIDANGNVGIGTISPTDALNIVSASATNTGVTVLNSNASGVAQLALNSDVTNSSLKTFGSGNGGGTQLATSGLALDIYNTSASGSVRLRTNAGVSLVVNSSGNIGIGTTAPNEKLSVGGVTSLLETTAPALTASYGKIYVKSSDSKLYFMNSSGVETQLGASAGASVASVTGVAGEIAIAGSSTNPTIGLATTGVSAGTYGSASQIPILTVDSKGRVTNASYLSAAIAPSQITAGGASNTNFLQWNGTNWAAASFAASVAAAESDPTVPSYFKAAPQARLVNNAGKLDLSSSGVSAATYGSSTQIPVLTVDTYGRITSATYSSLNAYGDGSTILASFGSASAPGLAFLGDSDTGIFEASANTLGFSTGGSERLRIDSAGNIGIGTNAPASPLDMQITSTDPAGLTGANYSLTYAPSSSAAGAQINLLSANASVTGSSYDSGYVTAITGTAAALGTASFDQLMGGYFAATSQNTTSGSLYGVKGFASQQVGTASYGYGIYGDTYAGGGGFVNAYGGYFTTRATFNSITNGYGVYGEVKGNAITTISNAYGVYASVNPNGGTISKRYGVYVADVGNGANYYDIYAAGNGKNYLSGNTAVGTTSFNSTFNVGGVLSLLETAAPGSTASYGKIYVSSADKKLYFMDSTGAATSLGAAPAVAVASITGTAGEISITGASTSPNISLATTGVSAATYGAADKTLILTVDSKGRLTSASQASIAIAPSQITTGGGSTGDYLKWSGTNWVSSSFGTAVAASESDPTVATFAKSATGLSARITTTANQLDLASSGVVANTYGSATQIPILTVDTYGRVTGATYSTLNSYSNGNILLASFGSATAPGISFNGDSDTGFYEKAADQIGFTTGGTLRMLLANSYLKSFYDPGPQINLTNSVGASTPAYTFGSDTTKGMFSSASGLGFSVGGVQVWDISSSSFSSATNGGALITSGAGTAAAPAYAFVGDTDTGIYNASANMLGLSTSGAERMKIDTNGNVGIGTVGLSPLSTLHLVNQTSNYSPAITNGYLFTSDPHWFIMDNSAASTVSKFNLNYFGTNQLSSITNAITYTDAATVYVQGPPKISNNNTTFTNSSGIYVDTVNMKPGTGSITNGYGLNVNAPTGATNNYAAVFSGGNVGIGSTSPNSLLTVGGVEALAETAAPASTTGYGKIYVQSSDHKLYFMDNSGSAVALGASAGGGVASITGTAGELTITGASTSPNVGLAATGVSAATYGSATQIPVLTVDSKGRVTNASYLAAAIAPSQISTGGGSTGDYLKWSGTNWVSSSFGAAVAASESDPTVPSYFKTAPQTRLANNGGKLDLSSSGVSAATYGSSTQIPVLTVDTYGRITSATYSSLSAYGDGSTILASFGSASAPGLAFLGDSDTGIFEASANYLGFSTGGSQKMVIDSSGNVGIGTAAPTYRMQVSGGGIGVSSSGQYTGFVLTNTNYNVATVIGANGGNDNGTIQLSNLGVVNAYITASGPSYLNGGNVGISTASPTAHLHLGAGSASASMAPLKFTSGTNLSTPEAGAMEYDGTNLYITDNTNTRRTLATTSAMAASYYTSGSILAASYGVAAAPGLTFNGDTSTGFFDNGGGQVGISISGSNLWNITSSSFGSTTTGGALISNSNAGTASYPTYAFAGDTTTGWFRPQAGTMAAATLGSERMRIASYGSVGIGTTSPSANSKLDVNGAIYVRGTNGIRFPASDSNLGGSIAIGPNALLNLDASPSAAYSNIALGSGSQVNNLGGTENVTVGKNSGWLISSSSYNTAVGSSAMLLHTGNDNTAIGDSALVGNGAGAGNVAIGKYAGYNVTSGAYNILIGAYTNSISGITTGSNNILIGQDVRAPAAVTSNNQLNIGNLLYSSGLGSGTTAATGGLGVGVTNPNATLSVGGVMSLLETTPPAQTTSYGKLYVSSADNKLYFMDSTGAATQLGSGGGYTAGSVLAASYGVAAAPGVTFNGNTDTGLFNSNPNTANDTIGIAIAGTNLWNITSSSFSATTNGGALITSGAGTAAAPAYAFVGDTDTGIYNASANYLGFSTGGSQKMVIDSSGNVGIGTSSPDELLSISKSDLTTYSPSSATQAFPMIGTAPAIHLKNTSGGTQLTGAFVYFEGSTGVGSTGTGYIGTQSHLMGSDILIGTGSTGGAGSYSEKMRVRWNGNVGIGVTSPSYMVSLNGTAARSIGMERNSTAATAGQGLTLTSGGAIAGTADLNGGDLTLSSGTSTGSGSSSIQFQTATGGVSAVTDRTPTTKMTILGSGNVGIGTTSPTARLQLPAGSASASMAPLKFTLGTNLSTPEAGAMEYDGTNLYITDNTNTRRTLATASAIAASYYTGGSILAASYGVAAAPGVTFNGNTDTGLFNSNPNTVDDAIGVAIAGTNLWNITSSSFSSSSIGGALMTSGAGTASYPAYAFVGDTDTGIFNASANYLGFSTGGAQRMVIDSSGKLGLNNSAPSATFDVTGTGHYTSYVGVGTAPGATAMLFVQGGTSTTKPFSAQYNSTATGTTTALANWYKYSSGIPSAGFAAEFDYQLEGFTDGSSPKAGTFVWGWEGAQTNDVSDRDSYMAFSTMLDNVNYERLRIGSTGVGIGTTSPTAALHLGAGSASASMAPLKFTSGTNLSTPEAGAMEYDGTNLYITDNTNTRRTLATASAIAASYYTGGSILAASYGVAAAPGVTFNGNTDTGLFNSNPNTANDAIGIAIAGTNLWNITSSSFSATTNGGALITSGAGTAAAPAYAFVGDTDTGIYNASANTLGFATNGTARMTLDSAGKLTVAGPIVSTPTTVASGLAVDLSLSNTIVLASVGGTSGSALTVALSNPANGGNYTIVITDTVSHTYDFSGCAAKYWKPAQALTTTGTRSMFTVTTINTGGSNYDCYINWSTGYQ